MTTRGRQRLTDREGKRLKAYRDSKGIPTIGVGHTTNAGPPAVKMGMTITAQECDDILVRDLAKFEAVLDKAIKVSVASRATDASRATVASRVLAASRALVAGWAEPISEWASG